MKKDKKPFESALKVQQGIEQPAQTNEEAIKKLASKKAKMPSFDELFAVFVRVTEYCLAEP